MRGDGGQVDGEKWTDPDCSLENLQDGLDVGEGGEVRSDWVHGGAVY